jgi:hypothetical protein
MTYSVRHRQYLPSLGRWLQQDLEGYHDGLNKYEYALSNSACYADPLGAAAGSLVFSVGWNDVLTRPQFRSQIAAYATGISKGATDFDRAASKDEKVDTGSTTDRQLLWFGSRMAAAASKLCPCVDYTYEFQGDKIKVLTRIPRAPGTTTKVSKEYCECFLKHPLGCSLMAKMRGSPETILPDPGDEWFVKNPRWEPISARAKRQPEYITANVRQDPVGTASPGALYMAHEMIHVTRQMGDEIRPEIDRVANMIGQEWDPPAGYQNRGNPSDSAFQLANWLFDERILEQCKKDNPQLEESATKAMQKWRQVWKEQAARR